VTHSEDSQRTNHESNGAEGNDSPKYFRYNPMRIIQWYRNLKDIDRFTFWIVVLTFFLVVMTGVQVLSYVESERAQILIEDIIVKDVDPFLLNPVDTILVLKNVGRHIAVITKVNLRVGFFIINKDLPKYPDYPDQFNISAVFTPVLPGGTYPMFIKNVAEPFTIPMEVVIKGVNDGTIPLRVFGVIEYDTGYWLSFGTIGFCFTYIPPSKRVSNQKFQACDNQRYTYYR
jgi:hypothetical protein